MDCVRVVHCDVDFGAFAAMLEDASSDGLVLGQFVPGPEISPY